MSSIIESRASWFVCAVVLALSACTESPDSSQVEPEEPPTLRVARTAQVTAMAGSAVTLPMVFIDGDIASVPYEIKKFLAHSAVRNASGGDGASVLIIQDTSMGPSAWHGEADYIKGLLEGENQSCFIFEDEDIYDCVVGVPLNSNICGKFFSPAFRRVDVVEASDVNGKKSSLALNYDTVWFVAPFDPVGTSTHHAGLVSILQDVLRAGNGVVASGLDITQADAALQADWEYVTHACPVKPRSV